MAATSSPRRSPCSRTTSNRNDVAPSLPSAVLAERPKAQSRELVVEVPTLAFDHGSSVAPCVRDRAVTKDHVGHLALGTPHGEGTDRARKPHRRQRQGRPRVIAHQLFHGLAPTNEARNLR